MLFPLYRLFGETLGAARLAIGVYSLFGIVGAYVAARAIGGSPVQRHGGGAAADVEPELPEELAPGARRVPALPRRSWRWRRLSSIADGRWIWLVVSGLLLGTALLVKPIIVAAVVPIALAALLGGVSVKPLLLVGLVSAAVVVGIVLMTRLLDRRGSDDRLLAEESAWSAAGAGART